jgi:hypothetical protein
MTDIDRADKLGAPGRQLWDSVTRPYVLEVHEEVLLLEACRAVDTLAVLDKLVRDEGVIVDSPTGPRAHPALVESRLQRQGVARLLAALRLPDGTGADAKRPQRRSGARPYGITGPVA